LNIVYLDAAVAVAGTIWSDSEESIAYLRTYFSYVTALFLNYY